MDKKYEFLKKERAPQILVQALKHYGLKEIKGAKHNPLILTMFKEIGWGSIKDDETAWCGAFVGYCAKQAGLTFPKNAVRALAWNEWGVGQRTAMLGDILTFSRSGGGHVGIYVGEDKDCYQVLGGNQSDMVNITRIEKKRLSEIRRTPWKIAQPANVRQIFFDAKGVISKNES